MSRKKKNKEEIKTDGWLATYADTITLILTFFVLLYSFSSVDSQKLSELSKSFKMSLLGESGDSILEYNKSNGALPIMSNDQPDELPENKKVYISESILQMVSKYVKNNKMEKEVKVVEDSRGVILQLKDRVFFDIGKANIKPESKPTLNKINSLISSLPNDILIEGHTDNVPIHNEKYDSNWHLASDRALNVLEYFVNEKKQLKPKRFKSQSCGEYQPIVKNDTPEHRAMNRRVNILIITNMKEKVKK